MASVSLLGIDVPKTFAGPADVETSLSVCIWPMGGIPLLFSTIAKELLACIGVCFGKLDELVTKVASSKLPDLSKDTDVCFITSLECTILPALAFSLGSINVGETISEETVPSVFILFVVVL